MCISPRVIRARSRGAENYVGKLYFGDVQTVIRIVL